MNQRNLVAGNWKMNLDSTEAIQLVQSLLSEESIKGKKIILGVPYLYLASLAKLTNGTNIEIAAQNCHQSKSGAFTGEISVEMLKSVGVDFVILGHSERRAYFGDTDEIIKEKVTRAIAGSLKVIYCCGEPLDVREKNEHQAYVSKQIKASLFGLSKDQVTDLMIAYEPIWAIGTGETASKEQAQEMHAFIRQLIAGHFGNEIAEAMTILYGGSVKPTNANDLFEMNDVDGGLVGGASLVADSFVKIVEAN